MSDPDDTLPGTPMRISPDGLQFIKDAEGCRLTAYRDSVGVLTIGFGHTAGVHGGLSVTPQQAEALLLDDLEAVYRCIQSKVSVPLSQGQFDALCSWIFNLGCGNFAASTLRAKLNEGDYEGAEKQFGRWVHAGGKSLPGLVTRRAGEAQMFAQADPDATNPQAA